MLSPKKQIVQAHAALRDLEKKHKRIVRKIDRGRRKVDKREVRLLKVEAELARLERRIVLLRQSTDGDGAAAIPPLRRAFLVFNPTSGSGGKESQTPRPLIEALRVHGIEAEVGLKTSGKVARQLTRQAVKNKYDLVIVGGGDGTIEDVASQLVGTETALGILPVGTRNNLARELGVSVVPLSVIFGDETYKEGVQIGHDLFYDKLVRSKVLPTTSAPSPGSVGISIARRRRASIACRHP